MANKGYSSKVMTMTGLAVAVVACLCLSPVARAAEVVTFDNGITATIVSAEEIQGQMKSAASSSIETESSMIVSPERRFIAPPSGSG